MCGDEGRIEGAATSLSWRYASPARAIFPGDAVRLVPKGSAGALGAEGAGDAVLVFARIR